MRRVAGAVVLAAVALWAPAASGITTVAQQSPAAGSGRLPGGPVPAPSGAGIPAPIVILALFAVLFLLVAAIAGAARLIGWVPAWAVAWRHSWHEAGYRIGSVWLVLRDRFRPRPGVRNPSRGRPPA